MKTVDEWIKAGNKVKLLPIGYSGQYHKGSKWEQQMAKQRGNNISNGIVAALEKAKSLGKSEYIGTPCGLCGGTARLVKNKCCAKCWGK